MILLQFILLTAIFIMGWTAGMLMAEEIKQSNKPRRKRLTYPTYGDESPEETFRMIEEAKKFKK